ncbi:MAG: OmpP1/FadL family transporter [Burkholderiales bacterium]
MMKNKLCGFCMLLGCVTTLEAQGAGFALLEQSASLLGNSFAGTAVAAEDASTVFFNLAGLTQLRGIQGVVAVHGINVSTKFSGPGASAFPLGAGTGGNAGDLAVVPNLYFSVPIGERLVFGLGINAPFGLKTEYESTWLGRFQGIKSDLKTINVNPSLAFKVSESVSLGAGINWQSAETELTNAAFIAAGPTEGRAQLEAGDDAWGWNVGALFQLGEDMRVGFAYRSKMDYTLQGTLSIMTTGGAPVTSFSSQADITFPDIATLSVLQKYTDKWDLLGDLSWTHWSVIDSVSVINRANGTTLDQLAFRFKDAWRLALGTNYRLDERWTIKGGVAYDESPVDGSNRTVRLPDSDRVWISFGAKYRFSGAGAVDIGYAHLFSGNGSINNTRTVAGAISTTVTGEYDASVDIFSAQLSMAF